MMKISLIYEQLYHAYGPQNWWPADSAFEMMTGAILTQNTAWTNVVRAINNFSGRLSPDFIAESDLSSLIDIIRPSGFYNQKAVRLKSLTAWFMSYDCDITELKSQDASLIRKELLAISGVGHETADSILLYALEKSYFVIDAYTRRIFSRLGFELADKYDEIRSFFEGELPADSLLFNEYHALIVRHAKQHCKKRPDCVNCPLLAMCRLAFTLDKTSHLL